MTPQDLDEATLVTVRRQWNNYRQATVPLKALSRPHWSRLSGGVSCTAPRPFLHAYVSCEAVVDGELAHSCRHGRGPHSIKVCVVKKDNPRDVYERLAALAAQER